MKKTLLALAVIVLTLCVSDAQVVFTFGIEGSQGTTDFDNMASASTTSGGITLTGAANSGVFNSTASLGLGINHALTGDQTALFDTAAGVESMSFSFDQGVTLQAIDLNSWTNGTDEAFFTYSGGTIAITAEPFMPAGGIILAANEVVTLGATAGAFGLQSITVIPEPSTYAMIAVGAALLVGRQRFRRKTS